MWTVEMLYSENVKEAAEMLFLHVCVRQSPAFKIKYLLRVI